MKKKKITLAVIIIIGLIIVVGAGFFLTNKKTIFELKEKGKSEEVKIKNIETEMLGFENYNNELISLYIPKNWKVETAGDYTHYTFKVYNLENPAYQIFMNFKTEGYMKTQDAKNYFKQYYGDSNLFATMPVLSIKTTEGFYSIFNELGAINNTATFTFPTLNNFKATENLGATIYGGDLLVASFINENNIEGEGLFTATVKDVGSYYVSSNIMDMSSPQIDTYPLYVYNTIFITTPKNELINWKEVLLKCLSSLEYSENFATGFAQEQDSLMQTIKANSKIYNEISDGIMKSWETKNKSQDIISQKNSDATLSYERVYDVETGNIYKAYNGFTDDYKGEKYKPVTDLMYTEPIDGYIEK